MSDQTVKTWGTGAGNVEGGLISVPGFERIQKIACGSTWICGLDNSGEPFCLAPSLYEEQDRAVAVDRSAAMDDDFGELAVGYHAAFLIGEASAYSWGANFNAQLVTDEASGFPLVAESLVRCDPGGTPRAVDAEEGVTCFALTDGAARCWGTDQDGALGQPELTHPYPDGNNLGNQDGEYGWELPAIDLGVGIKVRSIATSGTHTCALLENNRIKCWGRNLSGQLGIGTTEDALGDDLGEMGEALPYALIE
jgi:alpha-tubulin suppressor-like RCC1 family protein